MEHSTGTTTPADRHAERQARNNWLIAELNRLAATTPDPTESARCRRAADSLVRLAIAMRA